MAGATRVSLSGYVVKTTGNSTGAGRRRTHSTSRAAGHTQVREKISRNEQGSDAAAAVAATVPSADRRGSRYRCVASASDALKLACCRTSPLPLPSSASTVRRSYLHSESRRRRGVGADNTARTLTDAGDRR